MKAPYNHMEKKKTFILLNFEKLEKNITKEYTYQEEVKRM